MKKEEFVSVMKTLGVAFNREITQELLIVYYEVLKEEKVDNLKNAVKKILKTNKYFPTVAELLVECEKQNTKKDFAILELMKEKGYFKESEYGISEYEKAFNWLSTGIIPNWFKEDMKKYSNILNNNQIENKKIKELSYE